MVAGTGRPGGPVHRDVDLVAHGQGPGLVASEQTGQAGRDRGAEHD